MTNVPFRVMGKNFVFMVFSLLPRSSKSGNEVVLPFCTQKKQSQLRKVGGDDREVTDGSGMTHGGSEVDTGSG